MKKTVLTFGLICGVIMSTLMAATVPFHDQIGFDKGLVIGYTSMVVSFLLVYFGIRSYRDNVGRGSISFGRAVSVGLLIAVIASLCYTATWEVLYFNFLPDFGTKYVQHEVDRAREKGKSEAEVAKLKAKLDKDFANYDNPVVNSAYTFAEPMPVGLIITLVSAGILSRKRRSQNGVLAAA